MAFYRFTEFTEFTSPGRIEIYHFTDLPNLPWPDERRNLPIYRFTKFTIARRAAKFTNLPIYQIYHCPESVLSLASCLTQWRLSYKLKNLLQDQKLKAWEAWGRRFALAIYLPLLPLVSCCALVDQQWAKWPRFLCCLQLPTSQCVVLVPHPPGESLSVSVSGRCAPRQFCVASAALSDSLYGLWTLRWTLDTAAGWLSAWTPVAGRHGCVAWQAQHLVTPSVKHQDAGRRDHRSCFARQTGFKLKLVSDIISVRHGSRLVSDWFQNGFRLISDTVSDWFQAGFQPRFQTGFRHGFRLVSNWLQNGFRHGFTLVSECLSGWFQNDIRHGFRLVQARLQTCLQTRFQTGCKLVSEWFQPRFQLGFNLVSKWSQTGSRHGFKHGFRLVSGWFQTHFQIGF